MLINTFLHFPGIGQKKERELWASGVRTWDDYEKRYLGQERLFLSEEPSEIAKLLEQSRTALARGDVDYFAERLPKREHYRIALTVPSDTVFLDIETTGLSFYYDEITVIGVSRGGQYDCYIKGRDLGPIRKSLKDAKCLVTFNGTIFDSKFIQKEFPKLTLPKAHVDLRFAGKSVGFSGGQKIIENEIGVKRIEEIQGMIGERAPLLWHEYRLGNIDSAKQLIKYNFADIEGMKTIFDVVVDRIVERSNVLMPRPPVRFSKVKKRISFASKRQTAKRNQPYIPRFKGRLGPAITYKDLSTGTRSKDLRVVGIDLVGSESRASGWCALHGAKATTDMVKSDLELFTKTINATPDVVSIDSPLSLPTGRVSVHDSDPGRKEFGIMRICERQLKRRGVNVYPCLINSMQSLTARGIRLAKAFREVGIPVIESYPGAAQDIMGIPRKRAGLEYLKKGLADFGLEGEFVEKEVTHDELDAITSAAVGLFFWSGKFEALGTEEEEYLIIPDLEVEPRDWQEWDVIGFSGPIASGKTTAAKLMEDRDYAYTRYSLVLQDMLTEEGAKPNRDTLQELGDRVHKERGQRWLSKQVVGRLEGEKRIVVDGLRWPEDHAYMVERFGPGFLHVHIWAPHEVRKQRYKKMRLTVKEFNRASSHPVEAQVEALSRKATLRVPNDSTKVSFARRLVRAIKQERKQWG